MRITMITHNSLLFVGFVLLVIVKQMIFAEEKNILGERCAA